MTYFTIAELCRSNDAIRLGIINKPTGAIADHMVEMVEKALDDIRHGWGSGITVTSGFRCTELNKVVSRSSTSAHTTGYAADLVPTNGNMAGFQRHILRWAVSHPFDQIILEYPDANNIARWIHFGWKNSKGQQRRQILVTKDGKKYQTFARKSLN